MPFISFILSVLFAKHSFNWFGNPRCITRYNFDNFVGYEVRHDSEKYVGERFHLPIWIII